MPWYSPVVTCTAYSGATGAVPGAGADGAQDGTPATQMVRRKSRVRIAVSFVSALRLLKD
jgi:hypothetical protein